MSSKTRTRIECLEPIGFRAGCLNDFPDADAHLVTQHGKFINHTNVNIPVSILQNLLHLCNSRRGNLFYITLQNRPVHGCNHFCCILAHAADDLRGIFCLIDQVTRIHTLRRESQIEIFSALQSGTFLQNRFYQFLRGTRIGGGLQNNHGILRQIFGNGFGGFSDTAKIRLLMDVQRGRNADSDEIHILDKAKIRGRRKSSFLHQALQILIYHITDVIMTFIDHLYLYFLLIKADGLESCLGFLYCQGQSYIAETDDAYHDLPVFNFI